MTIVMTIKSISKESNEWTFCQSNNVSMEKWKKRNASQIDVLLFLILKIVILGSLRQQL